MPSKEKRERRLRDQIDEADSKIADLDIRVQKAGGELEAYYREAMSKLTEVRSLADLQLERLRESGEEAWDDLKDEVDDAIDRLSANLNSLVARFSDDDAAEAKSHTEADNSKNKVSTSELKKSRK